MLENEKNEGDWNISLIDGHFVTTDNTGIFAFYINTIRKILYLTIVFKASHRKEWEQVDVS